MIACGVCENGHRFVPPRARCAACGQALAIEQVEPRGQLLTWTVLARPPEGYPASQVGVVRLDCGALVLARIAPGREVGDAVHVASRDDGFDAS